MENVEFPRFMCRAGGSWELETGRYSVQMAKDQDALDAAWADGWRFDQYAARDVEQGDTKIAAQVLAGEIDADVVKNIKAGQANRAELEAKAAELGLTYHHKTGDKKLADLIAAKLAS